MPSVVERWLGDDSVAKYSLAVWGGLFEFHAQYPLTLDHADEYGKSLGLAAGIAIFERYTLSQELLTDLVQLFELGGCVLLVCGQIELFGEDNAPDIAAICCHGASRMTDQGEIAEILIVQKTADHVGELEVSMLAAESGPVTCRDKIGEEEDIPQKAISNCQEPPFWQESRCRCLLGYCCEERCAFASMVARS